MEAKFLTCKEACKYLSIGRTKLWELTKTGKIPAYRIDRTKIKSELRYKVEDLNDYMENNRVRT